jgi:hypothetical protein
MTGKNCDLFTHKSSRSYLNHLLFTIRTEIQTEVKVRIVKFSVMRPHDSPEDAVLAETSIGI